MEANELPSAAVCDETNNPAATVACRSPLRINFLVVGNVPGHVVHASHIDSGQVYAERALSVPQSLGHPTTISLPRTSWMALSTESPEAGVSFGGFCRKLRHWLLAGEGTEACRKKPLGYTSSLLITVSHHRVYRCCSRSH